MFSSANWSKAVLRSRLVGRTISPFFRTVILFPSTVISARAFPNVRESASALFSLPSSLMLPFVPPVDAGVSTVCGSFADKAVGNVRNSAVRPGNNFERRSFDNMSIELSDINAVVALIGG